MVVGAGQYQFIIHEVGNNYVGRSDFAFHQTDVLMLP
jgi:hypothetical protein